MQSLFTSVSFSSPLHPWTQQGPLPLFKLWQVVRAGVQSFENLITESRTILSLSKQYIISKVTFCWQFPHGFWLVKEINRRWLNLRVQCTELAACHPQKRGREGLSATEPLLISLLLQHLCCCCCCRSILPSLHHTMTHSLASSPLRPRDGQQERDERGLRRHLHVQRRGGAAGREALEDGGHRGAGAPYQHEGHRALHEGHLPRRWWSLAWAWLHL